MTSTVTAPPSISTSVWVGVDPTSRRSLPRSSTTDAPLGSDVKWTVMARRSSTALGSASIWLAATWIWVCHAFHRDPASTRIVWAPGERSVTCTGVLSPSRCPSTVTFAPLGSVSSVKPVPATFVPAVAGVAPSAMSTTAGSERVSPGATCTCIDHGRKPRLRTSSRWEVFGITLRITKGLDVAGTPCSSNITTGSAGVVVSWIVPGVPGLRKYQAPSPATPSSMSPPAASTAPRTPLPFFFESRDVSSVGSGASGRGDEGPGSKGEGAPPLGMIGVGLGGRGPSPGSDAWEPEL